MKDGGEAWLPITYDDGSLGRIVAPTEKKALLTVGLTKDGLKWRRAMPRVRALLRKIEFPETEWDEKWCVACRPHAQMTHAPDCELAALIREAEA